MQELEPPSSQIISSQDHAHAGGDIVGHDKIDLQKIENVEKQEFKQDIKIEVDKAIFVSQQKKSRVDVLIERLQHEIRNDVICKQKMDDILAHYKNISRDGVDGLEAKLKHTGQDALLMSAISQKETFTKLITRFSHYRSAKEIIAYLLSMICNYFDTHIVPLLEQGKVDEINEAITSKIVDPVMAEIANDIMGMDYNHVRGMIYWLAEWCFVRWHDDKPSV